MKKLAVLALVLGSLMLTGCAAHLYSASTINQSKTEVVLGQKNFVVVKNVEGQASATYFFGIGGLSKKAIRSNAVAEMTKAAHLKGSQTIINVNVKQTVGGVIPIFMRHTFTATGTVVEFVE